MKENLNVYYAISQDGFSSQEFILVEDNNHQYGIVSCPKTTEFFRLPESKIQNFSSYIQEKDISAKDASQEPARSKVSALLKHLKNTEITKPLSPNMVNEALNSLNLK